MIHQACLLGHYMIPCMAQKHSSPSNLVILIMHAVCGVLLLFNRPLGIPPSGYTHSHVNVRLTSTNHKTKWE